jgi:hypothetical protein
MSNAGCMVVRVLHRSVPAYFHLLTQETRPGARGRNGTKFITKKLSIPNLKFLHAVRGDLCLRSALLWDIRQCRVVILHRRFGKTHRSHLKLSSLTF